ncbi:MAG: hypothetical protein IPM24_24730 [Bryobacterales bacterium]|nr:hypothetical protein [Bryobacterales bacterium]
MVVHGCDDGNKRQPDGCLRECLRKPER